MQDFTMQSLQIIKCTVIANGKKREKKTGMQPGTCCSAISRCTWTHMLAQKEDRECLLKETYAFFFKT